MASKVRAGLRTPRKELHGGPSKFWLQKPTTPRYEHRVQRRISLMKDSNPIRLCFLKHYQRLKETTTSSFTIGTGNGYIFLNPNGWNPGYSTSVHSVNIFGLNAVKRGRILRTQSL